MVQRANRREWLRVETIAEVASGQYANQACARWQSGSDGHLVFRQPPAAFEIGVKPGKIEVRSPTIRVIHEQEPKEVRVAQQLPPLHSAFGAKFRRADLFYLFTERRQPFQSASRGTTSTRSRSRRRPGIRRCKRMPAIHDAVESKRRLKE